MAELTKQQKSAVYDQGGKLLVSAAAGSGKTMVLVERLMRYITDPVSPANIDDFLIITYTKAAAAELREKIAKKLNQLLAEDGGNRHLQNQLQRLYLAKISTVHGFCAEIIRENAYRLNIPADFRLAEEDECSLLQQTVMEKLLEDAYDRIAEDSDFRITVDTQGFGRDDRRLPEIILSIYQSACCHLDPNAWLDQCVRESEVGDICDVGETIWGRYLIEDLHAYLDLYIPSIRRCAEVASISDGMDSAAVLLASMCEQMLLLRQSNTWDAIHQHLVLEFGTLRFGKNADAQLKERIKTIRNNCKDGLKKKQAVFSYSNAQIVYELGGCTPVVRGLVDLVRKFSAAYQLRKQQKRIMDFSDLEQRALDLLVGKRRTGVTQAAIEIGQRFREVMVDEYQDSNAVQDAIFSALTQKRQNCFMVGDVKQSIYQFRLADPGIFLEKYNAYVPAEEAADGQGRKVLLSQNFRSSLGVISGINDVFENCMSSQVGGLAYGEEEKLYGIDGRPELHDSEVEFYTISVEKDTYAEEASFVAGRIRQLLDSGAPVRCEEGLRPVRPEDIAVILRSPGSVGGYFADALESAGILCCFGDDQDVLQSEEVQFLRSLLQVIDNPLQDIPLVAVMMSRVFGFTADHMASLRKANTRSPIYSLLKDAQEQKVIAFYELLKKLRNFARISTVCELVEHILVLTRMDSIFLATNGNTEAIEAFLQLLSQAEQAGYRDVRSFLMYLDGLMERGLPSAQNNRTEGMVTILSIHKSKGLEYPVVFLSGLSKTFNREDLKEQVLCDRTLGLGVTYVDTKMRIRYPSIAKRAIMLKKTADSLSEELRVLYVAMTRAKDRLIMTYASRYLENAIREYALTMDFADRRLLATEVSSMGDWVLQTAMGRVESGELFALGDRPDHVNVAEPFWKISVISGDQSSVFEGVQTEEVTDDRESDYERLGTALSFVYPHVDATAHPSKLTATQLKGRQKDLEAAENTPDLKKFRSWQKPSFIQKSRDGLAIGTATHKALQFLSFSAPPAAEELDDALKDLQACGKLTEEELTLVNREGIYTFFHSSLGQMLCSSANVLKEFKFSILVDGQQFSHGLAGEKVLLQGVVDCAIVDSSGITIIDFKTDSVTDETIGSVADGYRMQINAYADALSKIYRLPIKNKVLYFLHINTPIDVE